jgi:hypothetical protein
VPTVGGAEVYVEVTREAGVKSPVILSHSPYTVFNESAPRDERRGGLARVAPRASLAP